MASVQIYTLTNLLLFLGLILPLVPFFVLQELAGDLLKLLRLVFSFLPPLPLLEP
jgi:hypothetical protein